MRAVFDLGQAYDVSEVGLFHGNGSGLLNVKYLPRSAPTRRKDASYTLVEAHVPSIWNALGDGQADRDASAPGTSSSPSRRTRRSPNYSEIRVKPGTAVGGRRRRHASPRAGIVSKVGTGEYQSFFLVDGKIYALGIGARTSASTAARRACRCRSTCRRTCASSTCSPASTNRSRPTRTAHVWGWGTNGSGVGGLGTVGGDEDATTDDRSRRRERPRRSTRVVLVYSRFAQNFAVKSDGTVWFWGNCDHGTAASRAERRVRRPTPIPIPDPERRQDREARDEHARPRTRVGRQRLRVGQRRRVRQPDRIIANGADGSTPMKVTGLPTNVVDIACVDRLQLRAHERRRPLGLRACAASTWASATGTAVDAAVVNERVGLPAQGQRGRRQRRDDARRPHRRNALGLGRQRPRRGRQPRRCRTGRKRRATTRCGAARKSW